MTLVRLRGAIALAALCSVAHADVPTTELPVTAVVLPNGLRVLIAPDPSVSSVVVHVRYGSGAADDDHGYAHLAERLMFDGSVHVKSGDFDARIDAVGGWTSSTTAADHLSVFELVPAEATPLVLWLEAERMAGLADGITEAGLAREVAGIANERRAAYDRHGYGLVARAVERSLWGTGANGRDVLGDGVAPTLATIRAYVRGHLVPNNATLVIAGDVDVSATLELVRRDFGWIPRGPRVPLIAADDRALPAASTVVVADPIPKAVVAFRTSADDAPDTMALEIAAALLGKRASHVLVDGGLAADVHAELVHQARGGELRISATAKPGVDPSQLATAITRTIAELRAHEPSSDELSRSRTAVEAELVESFETLAVRADALARRATWSQVGDYLRTYRAALHAITPHALQLAVRALADDASVTVIGR